MAFPSSPTSFTDIHPCIIITHILPLLDGPSLFTVTTASSYLQNLCTDQNLWSDICKSTWPSITDPHVDDVISTFPDGHRSFYKDSFPALITQEKYNRSDHPTSHLYCPPELISAVDIHYQNDIVYSIVNFTDTSTHFLPSALCFELNQDKPVSGISRSISLKVDELLGADHATISHLKESVTLNWILIDPTRKRAVNLSSIKPVVAKKDWMTDEIRLRYDTVLPGCDPNEMVQCRIEVTLAVDIGGVGLHVREVVLQIRDLECRVLNGKEFLVTAERAILEENDVRRRKVVEREKRYKEFKEMRRENMERVKKEQQKYREFLVKVNYIILILVLLCFLFILDLLL